MIDRPLRRGGLLGFAVLLLIVSGAPACATTTEDDDDSSSAAVSETINVTSAKVAICDDEAGGCPKCDEKIGDYTLTDDEREACTLKVLRGGIKDRVNALVSRVGRGGAFLRTSSGDVAKYRLVRIKVLPEVGQEMNARSQYTKLSGSFTINEGAGASGGVSVYSVAIPVRFAFEFEDKTGETPRQEVFVMRNTYNLTPFFYMNSVLAVNLSVGAILSQFGGGPVASALLSALGGNASLKLDAAHQVKWTTPVCADAFDGSPQDSTPVPASAPAPAGAPTVAVPAHASAGAPATPRDTLRVFDNDFLANVLLPACQQYKTDNGVDVRCDLGARQPTGSTQTILERNASLLNRKILPLSGCNVIDQRLLAANTYRISFVAPKSWGFASGHEAYLYEANSRASDVWQRQDEIQIIGADGDPGERCGTATLGNEDLCVHATTQKSRFGGACDAINAAGPRTFGISQSTGTTEDETLQFRVR